MHRPLALAFALAFLACATSNEPKVSREETQVTEFRARVAAVDQQTRVVTLVDAEGNRTTFRADEAVKNLPQVKVGDELVGELMESLAVEVRLRHRGGEGRPSRSPAWPRPRSPARSPRRGFRTADQGALHDRVDRQAGGRRQLRDSGAATS
jgi:hypothetical protein